MTALEAIETSIREDRVVVLPWTEELEQGLHALSQGEIARDDGIEFYAASTPERAYWCVRLTER